VDQQIGQRLGALLWRDALFVVLLGGTVAASSHWLSHVLDHDRGEAASEGQR
jgi:hypothetical protein